MRIRQPTVRPAGSALAVLALLVQVLVGVFGPATMLARQADAALAAQGVICHAIVPGDAGHPAPAHGHDDGGCPLCPVCTAMAQAVAPPAPAPAPPPPATRPAAAPLPAPSAGPPVVAARPHSAQPRAPPEPA